MSITMKVAIDEDDDNGGGNWWGFKWKQEGSLRLQEAGDLVAKAAKVSSSEELEGASWSGVGTVSLMHIRLSHGKGQSIWQKPTTLQKSECLGFAIGWPFPVYSGKTQGGYKK